MWCETWMRGVSLCVPTSSHHLTLLCCCFMGRSCSCFMESRLHAVFCEARVPTPTPPALRTLYRLAETYSHRPRSPMSALLFVCFLCPTGVGDLQNYCTPLYSQNTYNLQFYYVNGHNMSQIQVGEGGLSHPIPFYLLQAPQLSAAAVWCCVAPGCYVGVAPCDMWRGSRITRRCVCCPA